MRASPSLNLKPVSWPIRGPLLNNNLSKGARNTKVVRIARCQSCARIRVRAAASTRRADWCHLRGAPSSSWLADRATVFTSRSRAIQWRRCSVLPPAGTAIFGFTSRRVRCSRMNSPFRLNTPPKHCTVQHWCRTVLSGCATDLKYDAYSREECM